MSIHPFITNQAVDMDSPDPPVSASAIKRLMSPPSVEYQPPLWLDEPAPGGGRKRMHYDLSFQEDDRD